MAGARDGDDDAPRIAALERELAELRESRAHLQSLVESVPDFVMRLTLDGRISYLNRLAPGYQMADVVGRSAIDFTAPAYHDAVRATLAKVLATGEPASFESIAAGAAGQPRNYFTRYSPIMQAGEITSLACVATDVTSVKATARALAEREQRLELAVRAADIGYWHWDARADQVTWDAVSCRHLGVPKDGDTTTYAGFLERVHPLDRARVRQEVDESVARGAYAGLRFRTLTPAGELRWLMSTGSVERDAAGEITGLVGCLLDVSARTRLEDQLQQAQRMDAVGQLAAGVAHNFNNLLAAILPAIELTARRAPHTAPLLADVRAAAERSADVVRQLMAFAGGAVPSASDQPCDAVAVARGVVQLAGAVIDRRFALSVRAPARPVPVRAEPGELEQALLNLVLNARDAHEARPGEAPFICIEIDAPAHDRPATLRVVDNGTGMSDDTRRRAIEPFFTTKPAGRGTGLGLSSVYAMATARGGTLRLDSTPGVGTTVTLELPWADDVGVPSSVSAPAPSGSERVLFVDDEPVVRRAVANVLTDEGYAVTAVGDPAEAIALFAATPDAFDLVILDESMPGMSGRVVLERLLAIKPDVRVISFSGLDRAMPGARAHLVKPASIDRLLTTIRQVLDAPAEPG